MLRRRRHSATDVPASTRIHVKGANAVHLGETLSCALDQAEAVVAVGHVLEREVAECQYLRVRPTVADDVEALRANSRTVEEPKATRSQA